MDSFWDFLTGQTDIGFKDMGYTVSESNYTPNQFLTNAIQNLQGYGSNLFQKGESLFDPTSALNQALKSNMEAQGADSLAQQNQMAAVNAARMGGPSGGAIINANQAANTVANTNAITQGWQNALMNRQQQALGFMQGGIGAQGQAGGFAGQIDSNTLQNNMFNAEARNREAEYQRSNYLNQQYANAAKSGNFINQAMSLAGNIVAPGLSTAFSNWMNPGSPGGGVTTQPVNNMYQGNINPNYGINQPWMQNQFSSYFGGGGYGG